MFVGGMWQFETDLACYFAAPSKGFIYVNALYTTKAVIFNFLIYATLHSFLFGAFCRAIGASWAEVMIDIQVGVGGFGFYIAGYYWANKGFFGRSVNAGFWTAFYAAVIVLPLWFVIKAPVEVEDGG